MDAPDCTTMLPLFPAEVTAPDPMVTTPELLEMAEPLLNTTVPLLPPTDVADPEPMYTPPDVLLDVPELRTIEPLTPVAVLPVTMSINPLLPCRAVPEDRMTDPDVPIEAALADRTTTLPEDEDEPDPLAMDTTPPTAEVSVVSPATRIRLPPVLLVVAPTTRDREPLAPPVLDPVATTTEPAEPAKAVPLLRMIRPDVPALRTVPVAMNTAPELPEYAVPEDNNTVPDTPVPAEFAERTYTGPEEVVGEELVPLSRNTGPLFTSPAPDRMMTAPPVSPAAVVAPPAITTGEPGCAFDVPTTTDTEPAAPPCASDDATRMRPLLPDADVPVTRVMLPVSPAYSAFAVRIEMAPLDDDVPAPLNREIVPPTFCVVVVVPARINTPAPVPDVALPAVTLMVPAEPDVAGPVNRFKEPDCPDTELPDPTCTVPDEPHAVVPLLSSM